MGFGLNVLWLGLIIVGVLTGKDLTWHISLRRLTFFPISFRRLFYRLIVTLRHMVSRGKTVLLTSHDLGQVERVCDHVGVLHEGELKHEARLSASHTDPHSQQPASTDRSPSLESLLWDVVGVPQVVELSWL